VPSESRGEILEQQLGPHTPCERRRRTSLSRSSAALDGPIRPLPSISTRTTRRNPLIFLVGRLGLEPRTNGLKDPESHDERRQLAAPSLRARARSGTELQRRRPHGPIRPLSSDPASSPRPARLPAPRGSETLAPPRSSRTRCARRERPGIHGRRVGPPARAEWAAGDASAQEQPAHAMRLCRGLDAPRCARKPESGSPFRALRVELAGSAPDTEPPGPAVRFAIGPFIRRPAGRDTEPSSANANRSRPKNSARASHGSVPAMRMST